MGFKKDIQKGELVLKYGKIVSIFSDIIGKQLSVSVGYYINKNEADKDLIGNETFDFKFPCTKQELKGSLYDLAYAKIKEHYVNIQSVDTGSSINKPETRLIGAIDD